jgi:hypothetical protein
MKFRGDEPLSGLNSLYNNVWNTWNWWCLTFGGIFSSINLDSSFIDVILLTNLIFLASKLEVPTLNIIWSFLHDHDFKEITKIVKNKLIRILTEEKTLRKLAIIYYYRIVHGYIEFPYCTLLVDKSKNQNCSHASNLKSSHNLI